MTWVGGASNGAIRRSFRLGASVPGLFSGAHPALADASTLGRGVEVASYGANRGFSGPLPRLLTGAHPALAGASTLGPGVEVASDGAIRRFLGPLPGCSRAPTRPIAKRRPSLGRGWTGPLTEPPGESKSGLQNRGQNCLAIMDSYLEAFSQDPTDGSFAA